MKQSPSKNSLGFEAMAVLRPDTFFLLRVKPV